MKKAFSLGTGVLLYVKVRKMTCSPIIKFPTKKELLNLDEEGIFSQCRRTPVRQGEKKFVCQLFLIKKNCLVWMKKALSHDAGVCFIRQVGKRALFAKINNSD